MCVKMSDYEVRYKEISSFILRKLEHRKYNKRPLELKYLWIAKATGYSYQQVRWVVNKLVKSQIIDKYHSWVKLESGRYIQRNFYRRIG